MRRVGGIRERSLGVSVVGGGGGGGGLLRCADDDDDDDDDTVILVLLFSKYLVVFRSGFTELCGVCRGSLCAG